MVAGHCQACLALESFWRRSSNMVSKACRKVTLAAPRARSCPFRAARRRSTASSLAVSSVTSG